MRIPEHEEDQEPVHAPPAGDTEEPEQEKAGEEAPVHEEKVPTGTDVVTARCRELTAEERARPASALAPLLAGARTTPREQCGNTSEPSSAQRSRLPHSAEPAAFSTPSPSWEGRRGDMGSGRPRW